MNAVGVAQVWSALEEVMDPEIPVSLVDLGMIYDVRVEGSTAHVVMTFTAVGCPCMEWIQDDIRERLSRIPGVENVVIEVVWDPPWTAGRLSEKARQAMRQWGIQS